MCKFFSGVSNGDGKLLYFNAEHRKDQKLRRKYESFDSHTSIADYYGYTGALEDKLNKYEYNPITKLFEIDQLNNKKDDSKDIEDFCQELDFKNVIPELIIHPIIDPFFDLKTEVVTRNDLILLKRWACVWYSVRENVRDIIRDIIRDSVRDSVWGCVRDSVWGCVWDSVRPCVWYSVGENVKDIVWDSIWVCVWAYTSSFYNLKEWKYIKHKKGVNPFQSCIDLWNKGLVPIYDGANWSLYGGKEKILWTGKIEDIK